MKSIKELLDWWDRDEDVEDITTAEQVINKARGIYSREKAEAAKRCESCEGHGFLFMPINDTNTYAKGKCPDCNGTGEKGEE